ncbi:AtpZ/AtpI family protein [Sphingomonas flavescens]|jgi:ATP synthase protein I|uniref:AtpZ/AtpI family protein n=1 Tax=Sphingomonas flavescens TaxID=3132797 RepID=UPI002803E46B|nr:AtpZ/AtpI family protein [Sphingomonas limnosediminicola]
MAEDETGEVPKLPPDARLESLDERLERLQQAEAKRTEVPQVSPGTRIAQQAFGHLIGAPVGGAVIGWGIDSLAAMAGYKTFPLFLLLMLFFGFGVGLRNVVRITNTRSEPGN